MQEANNKICLFFFFSSACLVSRGTTTSTRERQTDRDRDRQSTCTKYGVYCTHGQVMVQVLRPLINVLRVRMEMGSSAR